MDTATEVKNQKILLASLRREIIEASTGLTSIYSEKKTVEKEVEDSKQELILNQVASDSIFAAIQGEQEALRQTERDSVNSVRRAEKEVDILKIQKKESMKELKRQNEWVYTAQEEVKILNTSIASLTEKEALKTEYIDDIEVLKIKREEAEEAYKEILLDAKLVSDETEAKQVHCKQNVDKAEKMLKELKSEAKLEKQKLDSTVKERNKVESDLEIYINRIRIAHEKQFPDKGFKI